MPGMVLTSIGFRCTSCTGIPSKFRKPFVSAFSTTSISRGAPGWGPPTAPVRLSYDVHEPKQVERPGESMVICHGLLGSKSNWRSLARRFSRDLGIPVYTLDMRNHGRSPHATPHTYPALAADVAHFFEEHHLEHVHLLGHSMGGKTVMALALNGKLNKALKSLICVDIAPTNAPIESQYNGYMDGMREIENAEISSKKEADRIMQKYEPLLSTRQFLLTNAVSTEGQNGPRITFRVAIPTLSEAIQGETVNGLGSFPFVPPSTAQTSTAQTTQSPRWDGPTLLIRGGGSDYVPDSALPGTKAFFPNLEVVTLDAGHWVHAEQPQGTGDAVVQFVRRVDGDQPTLA